MYNIYCTFETFFITMNLEKKLLDTIKLHYKEQFKTEKSQFDKSIEEYANSRRENIVNNYLQETNQMIIDARDYESVVLENKRLKEENIKLKDKLSNKDIVTTDELKETLENYFKAQEDPLRKLILRIATNSRPAF